MILAYVACGAPGQEEGLGQHRFTALPRTGENVLLYVEGVPFPAIVDAVYHNPRPAAGKAPDGEPSVTLRVQRA